MHIQNKNDSGTGSLRSALENAVDGDVIDLSGLHGTLSLKGALRPNAHVTITGPGRDLLTLDGGHHDRVFATAHSLKISNITIANGSVTSAALPSEGGCLFVAGVLSLTNATLKNCAADGTDNVNGYAYGGAVAVLGSAYIVSSTISDNTVTAPYYSGGGGIAIINQPGYSTSYISDSTVSGNSATAGTQTIGGGIAIGYASANYSTATATIVGSTISGNSLTSTSTPAYYYNGSYYYYGTSNGGGLWAQGASVTLTGTNVTSNRTLDNSLAAGGGVFLTNNYYYNPTTYETTLFGGDLTLQSSNVSDNKAESIYSNAGGGGIQASANITITNSIVSGIPPKPHVWLALSAPAEFTRANTAT